MGQSNIIGLVADRSLAELINSAGYQVLGGPDFQGAARRIAESTSALALLVVVDQQAPGFGPWLEQQAMNMPVAIIPSADGGLRSHPLALSVPTTAAAILERAGLPAAGPRAHEPIGLGGVIGAVIAPPVLAEPVTETPALSVDDAEGPGDPDFIPVPIPVLSDDEDPSPSAASVSVPKDALPSSGGGSTPRPAWLTQAGLQPRVTPLVHEPAQATIQPAPLSEAEPSPAPSHAPMHREPVAPQPAPEVLWGQQAASHPATQQVQPAVAPEVAEPWAPQQHVGFPAVQPPAHWAETPQPAAQPAALPWAPQQQYHLDQQPTLPQQRQADFRDQRSPFMRESMRANQDAVVLISWAAKGGVGKTSLTISSAQIAGEAGLDVLVIDANRGQASVRHNLRVDGLPSIYDARDGGAQKAIVSKETLMGRRPAARGPIHFDVVLGPPEDYAGAENTPASLYASVLAEARPHYDLIVVDTQILEAEGEMTDVWTDFLVPLLRGGGWGAGIFDESPTGLDHLDERLNMLNGRFGISNARMLSVSNMWEQFTDDDAAYVAQMFAGRATFLGSIENDISFHDRLTAGFIPTDATGVTPVIRLLLHQITGRPEFQLIEQEPSRVRRFFQKKKKK